MIGAISNTDLVTTAKESRNADGILRSLGAAVSKEESVDIAWGNLRELGSESRANFRRHKWIGVGKRCRLILNSSNYALIAVAYVDAHQLTVEVDETFSFRRIK